MGDTHTTTNTVINAAGRGAEEMVHAQVSKAFLGAAVATSTGICQTRPNRSSICDTLFYKTGMHARQRVVAIRAKYKAMEDGTALGNKYWSYRTSEGVAPRCISRVEAPRSKRGQAQTANA